jgi:hypothetical protein
MKGAVVVQAITLEMCGSRNAKAPHPTAAPEHITEKSAVLHLSVLPANACLMKEAGLEKLRASRLTEFFRVELGPGSIELFLPLVPDPGRQCRRGSPEKVVVGPKLQHLVFVDRTRRFPQP